MSKKKDRLVTRKVKSVVKYVFNEEEIGGLARELAQKTRKLGAIQAEMKQVVAGYKAQTTEAEASITVLSNKINDGWESRTMDCIATMNYPKPGRKLITRADNGEAVNEVAMDLEDLQGKFDDTHLLPENGSPDADGENITEEDDESE